MLTTGKNKMKGRTKVLIALSVVCVALALAGAGVYWIMQQPLYRPGMVRAQTSLEPPAGQSAEDESWEVAPGIRLHHFAAGQGRAVLVVHGGPGIPFRRPVAGLEPLTSRFRFHNYDQRGCGRSTRPFDRFPKGSFYRNMRTLEGTLGLAAQIADIERIRRLLGEERLVLVGHSFGALTSALYAAEFPERVAGLVLVAPADLLVMPPQNGDLFAEVRKRLPQAMLPEYEAFLGTYLDFGRLFERSEAETAQLNGRLARFYVEAARARGFSVPAEEGAEWGGFMVQAQYLSMGRRHDYRGALRPVSAPVLVIHGADDLQPEAVSRAYVDAFSQARLAVIEGAGHMPFSEQPERFAAAVTPLLSGLR
jgi:proline iminopeptidase